jgi:hypothetical protein
MVLQNATHIEYYLVGSNVEIVDQVSIQARIDKIEQGIQQVIARGR